MIQIQNIPLPIGGGEEQLRKRAARLLGLNPGQLRSLTLARQSIDARNRSEVHYVYTVELSMPQEVRLVENAPGRNVSRTERQAYAFPAAGRRSALPPVVEGMGPAGLFAALFLALRPGLVWLSFLCAEVLACLAAAGRYLRLIRPRVRALAE